MWLEKDVIYVNSGGDALMLLERAVTHSPTIPFNRNSSSSNPEDSENGLAPYIDPGKTGKRRGVNSWEVLNFYIQAAEGQCASSALASQTFIFKVA